MSSNWTVVVFTQMVTGRSLSLSLVVVVVVVVGDIYIPQSETICVQWCVSVLLLSSLFSMLLLLRVWWCAVLLLCLLRRPKIGLEKTL